MLRKTLCIWALLWVLLALPRFSNGQRLASMLGGNIYWRLDDDFEQSRNVTFRMITMWDRVDFAYTGTGVELAEGIPVALPAGSGITYANKFGLLQVMVGHYTFTYPNEFIIQRLDGDFVEGWFTQQVTLPEGAYVGNASITLFDGTPLIRSQQIFTVDANGDSISTGVEPNGGLERCNLVGPSPSPCEVYLDDQANPNPMDLFTTINIPRPEETDKYLKGRILQRNSPQVFPRLVMYMTGTNDGRSNQFPFPAFDRDGNDVVTYIALSTQSAAGSSHIDCDNGNTLTTFGCYGFNSGLDGPPFENVYYRLDLAGKFEFDFTKFFYSFTFKTTDGTNVATNELVINYCKPVVAVGGALDRAPEMFHYENGTGSIQRSAPTTYLECELEGPCQVTVYAAKFTSNSGVEIDSTIELTIVVDGPYFGGNFINQTRFSNGVTMATFQFAPNGIHGLDDIGSHKVVCFAAEGHTPCRSPPECYVVKIRGHAPDFIPPTPPLVNVGDDILWDVKTLAPVCAGFKVTFDLKASDQDKGDFVYIDVVDSTGDGEDLFSAPYYATREGNFTGDTAIAVVSVGYTLDFDTGIARDPLTREVSFPQDRSICATTYDNTRVVRRAFGDLPDGNYRSRTKCYLITFSGPPAFVTTANRMDGSPFGNLSGTVEQRSRTIDFYYGVEKSITFRAKDPNNDGTTRIFILEDPGIPNGAVVGPSTCEPQIVPVDWDPAGVFSNCAFASRTVTWTPHSGIDSTVMHRVCAVSRDSTPIPNCITDRMSSEGWYGEDHCVDLQVVTPVLEWTENSELGSISNDTKNAFVPCDIEYVIEARDLSTGRNVSDQIEPSPYHVIIEAVGNHTNKVEFRNITVGRTSRYVLVYKARRGDEGRQDLVCFTARDGFDVVRLPTVCVNIVVKRCVYCMQEGDTLQSVMRSLSLDYNWLRIWAANGNEDGDPDTTTATNPDILMTHGPRQIINVGSLYHVEDEDTVTGLASLFQTTAKHLLSMNPDVEGLVNSSTPLVPGQELCIIPCSILPIVPEKITQ